MIKKKIRKLRMKTHPIPGKKIIKSKKDKYNTRRKQKLDLKKMISKLEKLK